MSRESPLRSAEFDPSLSNLVDVRDNLHLQSACIVSTRASDYLASTAARTAFRGLEAFRPKRCASSLPDSGAF